MSQPHTNLSFDVVPGRVYDLQLLLQRTGDAPTGAGMMQIALTCGFEDAQGHPVDVRLIHSPVVVPDLDPCIIEVLPAGALSDDMTKVGAAQRFVLVPPDAVTLRLDGMPQDAVLHLISCDPVDVEWHSAQAQDILDAVTARASARFDLLAQIWPQVTTDGPMSDLVAIPVRQFKALMAWFAPRGDWSNILAQLQSGIDVEDFQLRMDRLAAQAEQSRPVIGFIGSERGRERLMGFAELVWLREDQLDAQLEMIGFDAIIVETTLGSGAEGTDWALAFSHLTGDLPAAGMRLFDAAAQADIPVHLWVTADQSAAPLWRDCLAQADRVIVEGDGWSEMRADMRVPRATEPAACSLAALGARQPDLMLVPVASDLFQFSELADFIAAGSLYQPLLTEFRYGFSRHGLQGRLAGLHFPAITEIARAEQRVLLQMATIVLLPAGSLRTDAELVDMAIDAIASGAIPVMYGTPRSDNTLLAALDQVHSTQDLITLQGLFRIRWLHERRWRILLTQVMADHVWSTSDRAALLGRDPMPADFDKPRVSVVLVTKRPHFLHKCFDVFRRQTWPDTELIMVFNTGTLPDDMPELRANERAYALPEAANIGECLNRGIALSTGRVWCKMDDDDFYSDRYLADTMAYYRSAQADVVGRQSAYFYFDGKQETISREFVSHRNYTLVSGQDHISGATLSAAMNWNGALFSTRDRNNADSNWVVRSIQDGARMFSGGFTDMVVYRDAVEANHTWRMSGIANLEERYALRADYNIFHVFEQRR